MKKRVLFFMDLTQDLDLLAPVLGKVVNQGDFPSLWITDRLYHYSPRVSRTLTKMGVSFRILPRLLVLAGIVPNLQNYHTLITVSESNQRPHRAAHRLTKIANRLGLKTFTMQHGFENIGLTYYDHIHTPDSVDFASQNILIWCNLDRLHSDVPEHIRRRCIPAGCPKKYSLEEIPSRPDCGKRIIGIFENLHWHRYDDKYRKRFVNDLYQTAISFPNIIFLIKPHHDEHWLTRFPQKNLSKLKNILIADPKSPEWEPYTAPAIIQISDAVITTPSTVALDAAILKKPTALACYHLLLTRYTPLTMLGSSQDWISFIASLDSYQEMEREQEKLKSFTNQILHGSMPEILISLSAKNSIT